jgi:ATP-dependent DNA helicase RecG
MLGLPRDSGQLRLRPEVLYPLFAPTTTLPGVGPRLGKLIEKVAGKNLASLCWHLPTGIIDRRFAPKLAEAPEGVIVTLTVTVDAHLKPGNRRLPYKVRCHDETGGLLLVFFHAHEDYLKRQLPVGQVRVVSGRLERYDGTLQMTHPDYIATPAEIAQLKRVEPVYPMTAGLTPKILGRAIQAAVGRAPELPEWIDAALLRKMKWPAWHTALWVAHNPTSDEDLSPNTPARRRLAYDELLANQLAMSLVRADQRRLPGRKVQGDGRLRAKLLAALPYKLTAAQQQAIAEIDADLASPHRMLRLLQGDVGSGKTVVALFAMLNAVEAGGQAAFLAPTEILARQHLATIEPLAAAAGVPVMLLTGRDKGKARAAILQRLADGSLPIVVGTHALVQDDVVFKDLALAVVDEQHRFGVEQRLALSDKGRQAHLLSMTATPIPRTLMMTVFGDLDVSRLMEKPPGRKPVDTRTLPLERLEEVIAAVRRAIAGGARVFWVCPLVDESDLMDLAAAEQRHADLRRTFGERVGLVHGRMKAAERDAAMAGFADGSLDILVATTVIEVGVDIPSASVMVVEHAERFGLAQLHQLRGRIGRGEAHSTCLLLYQAPLGETAKARLTILRETEDGFRIAEEDLRLRGAGELLGTKQSGLPDFRLAWPAEHADLIATAHDDARVILDRDPGLTTPRGKALRVLLYLFERDAGVKTLRAV